MKKDDGIKAFLKPKFYSKKNRSSDAFYFLTLLLLILFLLGIMINQNAYAKSHPKEKRTTEKIFPHGCKPVGFSFQNHMIVFQPNTTEEKQTLYFVHNLSHKNIKISESVTHEKPYVMHLDNRIKAGRWAALATDAKAMKFICTSKKRQSNKYKIANCAQLIDVCQYTRAKFASNNRGNYWAISNRSQRNAVRNLIRQGVHLRW